MSTAKQLKSPVIWSISNFYYIALVLLSSAPIVISYLIKTTTGDDGCNLCFWQRIIYWSLLSVSIISLISRLLPRLKLSSKMAEAGDAESRSVLYKDLSGAELLQTGLKLELCKKSKESRASFRNMLPITQKLFIAACLAGIILSGFHVLVEQHLVESKKFCHVFSTEQTDSFESFSEQIANQTASRCDIVNFTLLGLSLASWNVLYSTSLLLFTLLAIKKIRYMENLAANQVVSSEY